MLESSRGTTKQERCSVLPTASFIRGISSRPAVAQHRRLNSFDVEPVYLLAIPEHQKDLVKMNHGFLAVPH